MKQLTYAKPETWRTRFPVFIVTLGMALSLSPASFFRGHPQHENQHQSFRQDGHCNRIGQPDRKRLRFSFAFEPYDDDLFGREKFGHLQKGLSEKSPRIKTYKVGD